MKRTPIRMVEGERLLSPGDCRKLARLLGVLKVHLKSAIDSVIVPGTGEAMPGDAAGVRIDRRDIAAADEFIARLTMKRTPEQLKAFQYGLKAEIAKAQSHADADYARGRKWVCACGLCRVMREQGFKPTQECKPLRVF
jgi:hypothetical protein